MTTTTQNKIFELYNVTAGTGTNTGKIELTIRNRLSKSIKHYYLNETDNVMDYCKLYNIDTSFYSDDTGNDKTYDVDGSGLDDVTSRKLDDMFSLYSDLRKVDDTIPEWQLQRDYVSEFTYRLQVFIALLNNGYYKYNYNDYCQLWITTKMYRNNVIKEYNNLVRKYYNGKDNFIKNTISRNVIRLILKSI